MKYSPGKTVGNTATGTYGARWVVGRGIASRGVRASHLKLMQDSVNRPPKWEDENVTTSVWRRRRPRAGLAAPAPAPTVLAPRGSIGVAVRVPPWHTGASPLAPAPRTAPPPAPCSALTGSH